MRVFLFLILSVVNICAVPVTFDLKSQQEAKDNVRFQPVAISPVENDLPILGAGSANGMLLSGHLFKTVKRYFCWHAHYDNQSNILLYGTNGWIFPEQDVNLTLSYPSANPNVEEIEDHLIIGYQVIMFTDGADSAGFITGGGLLQDHISLSFVMSKITMVSYEFWLYGVPVSQVSAAAAVIAVNYELC